MQSSFILPQARRLPLPSGSAEIALPPSSQPGDMLPYPSGFSSFFFTPLFVCVSNIFIYLFRFFFLIENSSMFTLSGPCKIATCYICGPYLEKSDE